MGSEHSSQRQAQTKTQQQSDERAIASKPNQVTSAAVHPMLQLQRQIGNRAVTQLIQAKLTVNPAYDIYEQEADRTATAVVNSLNAPASTIAQRQEIPEEEKIQTKPLIQRMSAESAMEVTPQLEDSIQQARGSGQPLAESIREPMEQAFGADFSGVRIHTDNQADQLNRAIQAKAFTTGQDVFFRQGAYEPGSRGGQELIAHELTHVVQQTGALERVVRRFLSDRENIQIEYQHFPIFLNKHVNRPDVRKNYNPHITTQVYVGNYGPEIGSLHTYEDYRGVFSAIQYTLNFHINWKFYVPLAMRNNLLDHVISTHQEYVNRMIQQYRGTLRY